MRKNDAFEAAYNALTKIGKAPMNDESVDEIRRTISGANSLLVARAAEIAGRRNLQDLVPDLVTTFDRFMVNGSKTDKQCNAKNAISSALNKLKILDDAVFTAGAKYKQMEPTYGGYEDTAADLRCNCAMGLARIGRSDARYVLADMLVDSERAVRVAAVKALAYMASPESELLLRLKVLSGDKELDVISECFISLLVMSTDRSFEFVSRYLGSSDNAVAECAALCIGESRVSGAFEALQQCWENDPTPTRRRALLLLIALTRSNDALDFLLEVVRTSDEITFSQAITTLDLYADDESMRKVREALSLRNR